MSCAPPGLHLTCWHAFIKSLPGCELLYVFLTLFELLICHSENDPESVLPFASCTPLALLKCCYEIPSSWWVVVSSGLHLNCWHHAVGELLCASWTLNCWLTAMKFLPESELMCAFWALFELLTCCHHILSSLYLSSPIYSHCSILLTGLHFAGGPCSWSCEHSIYCEAIFHSFQIFSPTYFKLHRHLPCVLSLVWLILSFLLYLWFLTAAWTAILICLEHSFWIVQQGSNFNDSFTKAWEVYLKTQCALVNQEVDNYLRSIGSNDWFTMKHNPSEEECAKCRKIVFNNLLCKSRPCLLWAGSADISSAHSKTSNWSYWDLLECMMIQAHPYCVIGHDSSLCIAVWHAPIFAFLNH